MADAEERWLPVVGYNGLYEVSDFGRVRSVERWVRHGHNTMLIKSRVLRPKPAKYGHLTVTFSREGVLVTHYVHRLVLTAFVGHPPADHQACHFPDPDPSNNKLDNLVWGTAKENHRHMTIHGTKPKGESHRSAKLTEAQVKEILSRLSIVPRKWGLAKILAIEFGVDSSTISHIKRGRNWKHVV